MSYKMVIGEKKFPSLQHAVYVKKHMKLDPDYADCEGEIKELDDGTAILRLIRTVKKDKEKS